MNQEKSHKLLYYMACFAMSYEISEIPISLRVPRRISTKMKNKREIEGGGGVR